MKTVLHILSHIHHHNPNFINIFNDASDNSWQNQYVLFDNKSIQQPSYIAEHNVEVFSSNSQFLPWLRKEQSYFSLIIMHGSFNPTIWSLLAERTDIAKKVCWIVFGGDLIIEQYMQNKTALQTIENNRKAAMVNLKKIWVISPNEKDLIGEKYQTKNNVAHYLLPIFEPPTLSNNKQNKFDFLLGNSADKANRHEEILTTLSKYQATSTMLCPLSYPTSARQAKITQLGESLFGQQFTSLTSILAIEQYFTLIRQCRAFILPQTRQQAGQHWIFALKYGIPVFAEPQSPFASLIKQNGGLIFGLKDLKQPQISFAPINQNKLVFKHFFSREKLVHEWQKTILNNLKI